MTTVVKQALVSIHDVMPTTMAKVQSLLNMARRREASEVTLLVVPGLDWNRADIDRLRAWQDEGYTLAGHGWSHHCQTPRSISHRLHSWLLSRDVAEHLSASREERLQIISRCADWFDRHRLNLPALYVPPAWALALRGDELRHGPFRMVETLSGVIECATSHFRTLPLVGFEADTRLRRAALSCLNGANLAIHVMTERPLRVALHPDDLELSMAPQLRQLLSQCQVPIGYSQLFTPKTVQASPRL